MNPFFPNIVSTEEQHKFIIAITKELDSKVHRECEKRAKLYLDKEGCTICYDNNGVTRYTCTTVTINGCAIYVGDLEIKIDKQTNKIEYLYMNLYFDHFKMNEIKVHARLDCLDIDNNSQCLEITRFTDRHHNNYVLKGYIDGELCNEYELFNSVRIPIYTKKLGRLLLLGNDGHYSLTYSPSTKIYVAGCREFDKDDAIYHWRHILNSYSDKNLERPRRAKIFLIAIKNNKIDWNKK